MFFERLGRCLWHSAVVALVAVASAAAAEEPASITIGIVPSVPSASTYLALDRGYFRDAGIDVKIEIIDTASNMIPFLASNRMQVVQGGLSVGYFNAVAQGLPITIAFDGGSSPLYHDLLVRTDLKDQIKTIADLKGHSVIQVSANSIGVYELAKVLASAGLTLADVDSKYAPFTQMGAVLANQAVDTAMTVAPFGDLIVEKGLAVRFINTDDYVKPQPVTLVAYLVNTDWVAQNQALAHRLFVALLRASRDYCQAYHHAPIRAETVDVLVKYKVMSDRDLTDRIAWQARDPDGMPNMTSLADIQKFFFDAHILEHRAPDDRLADTRYAKAAAAELGPFVLANPTSPLKGCR